MSLDDLRRAKVNRAFRFYENLCSEMLYHCTDNWIKIDMSVRKQQEMQVFWDRSCLRAVADLMKSDFGSGWVKCYFFAIFG